MGTISVLVINNLRTLMKSSIIITKADRRYSHCPFLVYAYVL